MVFKSTFQERCLDIEPPTELSFLTVGIQVLLILTNIPGNLLIVLAVVFDPNKNLQTPFNWLILNLAIADLFVGTTLPLSVYFLIEEGLKKEITREEHKTFRALYFMSCAASVVSLLVLAFERHYAVSKPIIYRTKINNKRIILMIAGIWFISVCLSNIYLVVSFLLYAFIFAHITFTAAVIIIIVTYSLMKKIKNASLFKVNQGAFSFATTEAEIQPPQNQSSPPINTDGSSLNTVTKARQLLEAKVTEMFFVVVIALLCCYGFSIILIYLVHFCAVCSCVTLHWFRKFSILFVRMNSSVNFFCYASRSSRFRSSFAKLLRIKRHEDDNRSNNIIITRGPAAERNNQESRARGHSIEAIPFHREEAANL